MKLEGSSWQATETKPSLYNQKVKYISSNFKKATVAMNREEAKRCFKKQKEKIKEKNQWLIKALVFCSGNHSSASEQKRRKTKSSKNITLSTRIHFIPLTIITDII